MRADAVVAVLSRPHGEERGWVCELTSCSHPSHLASPSCPGEREYIRALKEKCCHVALDFDKEKEGFLLSPHPGKHQLPDGREIELGQETFLCMEALFQTDLIGEPAGRDGREPRRGQAGTVPEKTGRGGREGFCFEEPVVAALRPISQVPLTQAVTY